MTGFVLPENYTDDPKALIRKSRSRTASSSSVTPPASELVTPAPSATTTMAKSLRNYSTPAVANVPVGPTINTGIGNFKLRTRVFNFKNTKIQSSSMIMNTYQGHMT